MENKNFLLAKNIIKLPHKSIKQNYFIPTNGVYTYYWQNKILYTPLVIGVTIGRMA
jgi:hypothetical protein